MRVFTLARLGALGLALGWAASTPSAAYAQEGGTLTKASFTVDPQLAQTGEELFTREGCKGCHALGSDRGAGPDLLGVTERREIDWIRKFLTNPPQMLSSDPIAQQLLEEYNYVRMPNLHLSGAEVDALINYLAQESRAAQGSR